MTVNSKPNGIKAEMEGREAECLLAIARLNKDTGRRPSLDEIAGVMKLTKRRALDYVERLEDKGFIERERGVGRRKNRSIMVKFETVLLLASSATDKKQ